MNEKKDITIVIPAHNEEESLKVLIPELIDVISRTDRKFEIILVNDASTDNTAEIINNFALKYDFIKPVHFNKRSGQTGAYKVAFQMAKGEYIIRMDADLQDSPQDLPAFIEKIDEGADLVMGLREARKHRRIIRMASMMYDLLVVALFNFPLHSHTGSYVAFKSKYVKDIPWHKNDHRYIPLIAIKRGAKNLKEVFVRHNERKFGQSKYKPIKKIFFGVFEVLRFMIRYSSGVYDTKKK